MPVRPHDYEKIIKNTNPKILEFHLSYKDLDINVQSCFKDQINSELVVHAPELFENDLTLDLASDNQDYRNKSISEMRRVIDFTKNISEYFRSQNSIGIVTNVGGFTQDSPLTERQILERYDILLESLSELKDEKVEIWPQTMPPYPWHFGGQRFHNLFVNQEDITRFCTENKMRICLDVSHSKLACNRNIILWIIFRIRNAICCTPPHCRCNRGRRRGPTNRRRDRLPKPRQSN